LDFEGLVMEMWILGLCKMFPWFWLFDFDGQAFFRKMIGFLAFFPPVLLVV